jgi:hypothetical protein
VEYNGRTLHSLEDEFEAPQRALGQKTHTYTQKGYMSKHYKSDTTSGGMSLSAVVNAIQAHGFHPDSYWVISWHTTHDVVVFCRALFGYDQLIDTTLYKGLLNLRDSSGMLCPQPFSISLLAIAMHELNIPCLRLCVLVAISWQQHAILSTRKRHYGYSAVVQAVPAKDCRLGGVDGWLYLHALQRRGVL